MARGMTANKEWPAGEHAPAGERNDRRARTLEHLGQPVVLAHLAAVDTDNIADTRNWQWVVGRVKPVAVDPIIVGPIREICGIAQEELCDVVSSFGLLSSKTAPFAKEVMSPQIATQLTLIMS